MNGKSQDDQEYLRFTAQGFNCVWLPFNSQGNFIETFEMSQEHLDACLKGANHPQKLWFG